MVTRSTRGRGLGGFLITCASGSSGVRDEDEMDLPPFDWYGGDPGRS
ncbi:MAG: hypothetical protein AVDCRST_MAG59-3782 [uncultured Thermomicrobiales bacterium]|uniref:Uncharacterized protein n=1 Tax=uncultured Thermomicrobiales bacterium TaxID=1645740 RepID=A0A6J4VAC5_9BACT|nr:MAG: hypothetical protein AVDCRST_MAG59-3782 [uncultured Thermomicrobiales bacterium]